MDNVCHSLAGAVIAQAGFARRLPRATMLAVIAANIPDVDAFTYLGADSAFAVSFRRGWTHGLPALIVWALLLAAGFGWWNDRRAAGGARAIGWRPYFPLAALAVVSHTALDWLNNYGVRWLMPFSNEWFYGDSLFIVDPALIALFGLGWFVSSRMLAAGSRRAEVPARAALIVSLAYVVAMKTMSLATLGASRLAVGVTDTSPRAAMVAPLPFSFTQRELIVRRYLPDAQYSERYDSYPASWTWHGPQIGVRASSDSFIDSEEIRRVVRRTAGGERFLRWSRFPYFVYGAGAEAGTMFVGDFRYSSGTEESWAGVRLRWLDLRTASPDRR